MCNLFTDPLPPSVYSDRHDLHADSAQFAGRGWGSGSSGWWHLHGNTPTEGTGGGWVDELDHADVLHTTHGTSTLHTGGHGGLDGEVLVDVGGTSQYASTA